MVSCHRYLTFSGNDYRSNECMRQSFEPLYYKYGVDLQFHGEAMHSSARLKNMVTLLCAMAATGQESLDPLMCIAGLEACICH